MLMNRTVLNGVLTIVPTLTGDEEIEPSISAMVDGLGGGQCSMVYGRRCGRTLTGFSPKDISYNGPAPSCNIFCKEETKPGDLRILYRFRFPARGKLDRVNLPVYDPDLRIYFPFQSLPSFPIIIQA
jgi:hypothetical protein